MIETEEAHRVTAPAVPGMSSDHLKILRNNKDQEGGSFPCYFTNANTAAT